jgi:drug/metabolite transporter (DMT)-like permease
VPAAGRPRAPDLDRGWLLFITPLLWGATFPAAKLALEALDAPAFMAWTRALGLVTIVAAAPLLGGLGGVPVRRVVGPGLLLGGLIFGAYVLQTLGLEATTATNAGFITGLYVVFTPLLARALYRSSVRPAVWLAVGLSLAGLALLSTDSLSSFRPHRGDVLVLASAVAWAGHVVALARYAPRFPTRVIAVAQLAATAALHVVATAGVGWQVEAAWAVAPLLLVTGVLGTGVAYTLQIAAQKEISPARAAVILSGEALASALLSVVWIGERLLPHQWIGAALIVTAMVASETSARRFERAPFALEPRRRG